MADIFQINTLANACSYLTEAVGGNWTEQKVVSEAIKNNLRFCASIPEWVRPGIGELKIVGPDGFSYIDVLSDGLVGLEDFTLATLMKHGKANLRTIPWVTGDAPWIDFSHLRITWVELQKLSARLASKVESAPTKSAITSIRIDVKPDTNLSEWQKNARVIGTEIHVANILWNMDRIAQKTYDEMCRRHKNKVDGMTGRGGRVPSAGTIKRHALTGIKS